MAEGYAAFRPPLHARIMEMVKERLGWPGRVARALDVGCGAGLSTAALRDFAERRVAMDVAEPMLHAVATTAPGADCIAGRAEAIPVRAGCIDLITAAGSLNYAAVSLFFKEAARILTPGGVVVVYDFSTGRVEEPWFASFIVRYPWPPNEAVELDPQRLAKVDPDFHLESHDDFEIVIPLTRAFYIEYLMTETNVAFARRNGVPEAEIRSWCASTLGPIWGDDPREVHFRGYFACLSWFKVDS